MSDLADRLAAARKAGDPAPQELERLVELLASSDIDPGQRLTSALEGFARLSEERRQEREVEEPQRGGREAAPPHARRAPEASRAERTAEPRRDVPTRGGDEFEERLADFARQSQTARGDGGKDERSPAPPIASLRAALADISARQKALDDEAAPARRREEPRREAPARRTEGFESRAYAAPARPAPAADPVASRVMNELKSEIDRLGQTVKDLPTRSEIDRMTQEMADLARRLTEDRPARLDTKSLSAIDRLVSDVDRMRTDAASPQEIAKLGEELRAISSRLDVLGPRNANALDALARRIDDIRSELGQFPRIAAVDVVASEIQTLIARLDAQEAAAAPTREAVVGLAGHVRALDGRLAAIADATAAREKALDRYNASIKSELDSLPRAETVHDLGRQIDALTESLQSRSAIGPALKAVEGLAGKMEALDGKIAAVARPEAFDGLSRQIETLTERLSADMRAPSSDGLSAISRQIEALTERLESDRGAPDALARQIEMLTARLADDRQDDSAAKIQDLTSQIEGLGDRFDTMAAATRSRGAAFERVEDSVRAIAEQLLGSRQPSEAASSALETEVVRIVDSLDQHGGRIEDLHDAFSGLAARIERSCADLGAHTAETAAAAAREMLGAHGSDGRLESELAEALDQLKSSSAQSERRAADALDAVRSTLERMLDRMENMPAPASVTDEEREPRRRFGREPEKTPPNATEVARAAARRAMEEMEAEPAAPAPPLRAAATDDAPAFSNRDVSDASYGELGPDHPIEPGAGGPRAEAPLGSPASASAASLIASARRATLQSAGDAVVAEPLPAPERAERSSLFSGALTTLKKSRRPVLLGVAAVLIVLTALYVASGMTGEPEQAAPPPAPQSRAAPSDEPTFGARDDKPANASAEAASDTDGFAEAEDPAERQRAEAPPSPSTGPAQAEAPVAAAEAPRAPARDLTQFAFDAKSRADWKTAEPASTGSISRDPNALPEAIGGATLKSRAAAGDPAAELEVGDRLLDGRNTPSDPSAAARWFEKAAAQGSAPAQHRLGSLYEKGRGVARDVAAARRWYEQAAASGNVRAMHNLGVVHAEGGLGKPDYAAAMVWFRMAAERGLNDSGYNLAVLAARGLGGKRDLVEAYKWFALAARDGDEDAARKRDDVGKALGSSLPVAQAAVAAFQPKPVDPAANEPEAPAGGWDRVASR